MLNKKNFKTIEELRREIIALHMKKPNAIVSVSRRAANTLNVIAQKEHQKQVILDKKGRKVLAVIYDGEVHYFGNSKERFHFILQ